MNIIFTTWDIKLDKVLKEIRNEVKLENHFVYKDDSSLTDYEAIEEFTKELARCVRSDINFYVESLREVFLLAIRGLIKNGKAKCNGYVYFINEHGVINYSILSDSGELRPYPIGLFDVREKLIMRLL